MLESARRLTDLEGVPRVGIDTVASFWEQVRAESPDLPVWVGELYLEYHRGTYTTNGPDQARQPAQRAGVARSRAVVGRGGAGVSWDGYPAARLDEAWKLLLLNQFHDIIPGSSIHWANDDCLRDHARIEAITSEVITAAQLAMVERIDTVGPARPMSSCSTRRRGSRREVVSVETGEGPKLVPVSVPACGYVTIDPHAAAPDAPGEADEVGVSDRSLENALLRVEWDDDGLLTSIFDKEHRREVLAPGTRAATCSNCTRTTRKSSMRGTSTSTISTRGPTSPTCRRSPSVERGPLRGAVQFVRELGHSRITQTMRLTSGSRRLEFVTEVDWHERHKFLKVAFPVNVHAARATYEIQFGHLERPTHVNTSWDVARFEVCAHRWADLSEPGYGVALLNDCKYGYDVHGNVMRLSLLRAPGWPDPASDQGVAPLLVRAVPARGRSARSRRGRGGRGVQHPARRRVTPAPRGLVRLRPVADVAAERVVRVSRPSERDHRGGQESRPGRRAGRPHQRVVGRARSRADLHDPARPVGRPGRPARA